MSIEERLRVLENNVKRLIDEADITKIIASYGPLADTAEGVQGRQKVGDLFTENGLYDLGKDWQGRGPAGVAALLADQNHLDLMANGSAHIMSLPFIEVAGDRASAVSYSRVYRHSDGQFFIWRVSANYWEFVRKNGAWRVAVRTNRLLDGSADSKAVLRRVDTSKSV
jgi:hypothetical protein